MDLTTNIGEMPRVAARNGRWANFGFRVRILALRFLNRVQGWRIERSARSGICRATPYERFHLNPERFFHRRAQSYSSTDQETKGPWKLSRQRDGEPRMQWAESEAASTDVDGVKVIKALHPYPTPRAPNSRRGGTGRGVGNCDPERERAPAPNHPCAHLRQGFGSDGCLLQISALSPLSHISFRSRGTGRWPVGRRGGSGGSISRIIFDQAA